MGQSPESFRVISSSQTYTIYFFKKAFVVFSFVQKVLVMSFNQDIMGNEVDRGPVLLTVWRGAMGPRQ